MIICACCGLPNEIYLDSPTAQRVCNDCKNHNTGDWQRVSRLHVQWVVAYSKTVQELRTQELNSARDLVRARGTRIMKLEVELHQALGLIANNYETAPIGDLQQSIESEVVKRAEAGRNSAFDMRSAAMRVVWNIDRLHNDDAGGELCSCKKPAKSCRELAIVRPFTKTLDQWESREKSRLAQGRECGLPHDHPAMLAR